MTDITITYPVDDQYRYQIAICGWTKESALWLRDVVVRVNGSPRLYIGERFVIRDRDAAGQIIRKALAKGFTVSERQEASPTIAKSITVEAGWPSDVRARERQAAE